MLTAEENAMLTAVGPGTPTGELIRCYWQPIALAEELPSGGAPKPVRILGEDLALFRDDRGRVGLLGLHCSHRAADLSYGRVEDGGLRCLYHGWLYDIDGRCLEQPGEPLVGARLASPFHEKIRHPAYPCQERAGLIFAYMGKGEPPVLPLYEPFTVPDEQRALTKVMQGCNFLQANEGNIDPVHLSFLHRMALAGDQNQALNTRYVAPQIETEETEFGIRIYAVRPAGGDRNYVRVTNFVMPNLSAVAGDEEGYSINWHVPIDDTHHWRFSIRFNRTTPIEASSTWRRRSDEITDDYRLVRNKANRYLQDRDAMRDWSFIGLGRNFIVHDAWATEGEGPIQDRTVEHLGYTDKAITAARRMLLKAVRDVAEGAEPIHVIRDSSTTVVPNIYARNDVILPAHLDWRRFWEREDAKALAASTHG